MESERTIRKIKGGVYLVVDLKPGMSIIMPTLKAALDGGVDVIQLWNHHKLEEPYHNFVRAVCDLAHSYDVPVLIYENWRWLKDLPLDGVHFDTIPDDFEVIEQQVGRRFLAGLTCGNEMGPVQWAIQHQFDYISFCSMFPSSTSSTCTLVHPALVRHCRALTDMPIFVAGGINLDNLPSLLPLGIDGVAVVSGIMKAQDPKQAALDYKNVLHSKKQ